MAEIVVEHQHGDPRYLEEARKALADHRKLWGLDAPQKIDVRASRNPYDGMTEDDLRTGLARQAHLLGVPDASPADTSAPSPSGSTAILQEPSNVHHQ